MKRKPADPCRVSSNQTEATKMEGDITSKRPAASNTRNREKPTPMIEQDIRRDKKSLNGYWSRLRSTIACQQNLSCCKTISCMLGMKTILRWGFLPFLSLAGQCPQGQGQVFLPDPSGNCSRYLNCYNGEGSLSDCPPSLVFNPRNNICDWPASVQGCERVAASDRYSSRKWTWSPSSRFHSAWSFVCLWCRDYD